METNVYWEQGAPKGFSPSPWLFHIYFDEVISEIKKNAKGLDYLIAYTDDIAIYGSIDMKTVKNTLELWGFRLNLAKSASFWKKVAGLALRERYHYSGTTLDVRGIPTGKNKILKAVEKKSKNLARVGKQNSAKGR